MEEKIIMGCSREDISAIIEYCANEADIAMWRIEWDDYRIKVDCGDFMADEEFIFSDYDSCEDIRLLAAEIKDFFENCIDSDGELYREADEHDYRYELTQDFKTINDAIDHYGSIDYDDYNDEAKKLSELVDSAQRYIWYFTGLRDYIAEYGCASDHHIEPDEWAVDFFGASAIDDMRDKIFELAECYGYYIWSEGDGHECIVVGDYYR